MLNVTKTLVKRLATEDEAGNAVEYAIIAGIISVGLFAALVAFRDQLRTAFNNIKDKIAAFT